MMSGRISTGHHELDTVIDYLRPGDNVVWQIDTIEQYRQYANRFVDYAAENGHTVHYIRFGSHSPVVDTDRHPKLVEVHTPDSEAGFESFASELHQIISTIGRDAWYVFDCLSDLLERWSSDLMLGNFFRITCPYLYELDTIAWFSLMRGQHSYATIARIRETTQLLLDLYRIEQTDYIHPLKVWQRYSPTMFLPHRLDGEKCRPISSSADAAVLFSSVQTRQQQAERQIDFWDRLFLTAEQAADLCQDKPEEDPYCRRIFVRLCGLLIGDEGRIGELAQHWFNLSDLIEISRRQIGTGKIGGKAVGMLLSRKITEEVFRNQESVQAEPHDSFFLGSDLFYTYIVHNGWWKLRMQQKSANGYFNSAEKLRDHLRSGEFPAAIREKFQQMLEYFGQSPIIVRSSSLLEDDFGNAFAGKYESVFCANQGTPEDRAAAFEQAVRQVYASMFDESALAYRQNRGLDSRDEQMALLVQRVSGSYHGSCFYPWLAGVGHSRNLYVWDIRLDPHAGMIRLVYGLGTRAVDRVDGDYPRIIALDQPRLSVHSSREEEKVYSQHYVDLLDLGNNALCTMELKELQKRCSTDDLMLAADTDWESVRQLRELRIKSTPPPIINFRAILQEGRITAALQMIIKRLEQAYEWPVDIEFTINPGMNGDYLISLLQCRPLQTKQFGSTINFPENTPTDNILLQAEGGFMGGNACITADTIIYVEPAAYTVLPEQDRYQTARIIGLLNNILGQNKQAGKIMLIGPGRWGTTTPSLGIPIKFSEINHINILAEEAFETAGMIPEIAFGSHFFLDLVEADIFYLAIMPHKRGVVYRPGLLTSQPNLLADILPAHSDYASVIKVLCPDRNFTLFSDISSQKLLICQ
jgi:hypothetical protein